MSEPLELIVSVCVVVAVRVEVLDAVTGLFDGLVVGDLLRLGVREGEAAFDGVTVASLVGDTLLEIVRVSDRVILGDFDSERVILGDFDSDGVIEIVVLGEAIVVCETVIVRVAVFEALGDFDEEILSDTLNVCVKDTELVAVSVFDTV